MTCMGFDVGYQTSTFAVPKAGGIEVLLNDYSRRQTPTMVAFGEKQRVLGEGAKSKAITAPKNTVTYFKNLIGRQYKHPEVQAELSRAHCRHVEMPDGTVGFIVNHGGEDVTLSVKQLMGAHLAHLKSCVDVSLGSQVVDVVVGVPGFFNDAQRHAMLDACKIGGLNCLRLLNETSAVALAYGIYKKDLPKDTEKPRRVVFFDLGHSYLQMSCVDLLADKLSVVATAHAHVGGRDFDLALRDYMVEQFQQQSKESISQSARPLLKVEAECEKLKKQMSANTQQLPLNIECLYNDRDLHAHMERETFEAMCSGVISKVQATVDKFISTLKEKEVDVADIFAVEVVGGSCRIPAIKQIIQTAFGKEPSTTLNCDEAVARGCALMAAMESPTIQVRDYKVKDSTPFAVAWDWKSQDVASGSQELIKANAATGVTKVVTFECVSDLEIAVRYSEPENVTDGMKDIGMFSIQGIKPSNDGEKQEVKVSARLDGNGCFVIQDAVMIERVPQTEAVSQEGSEGTEEAAKEGDAMDVSNDTSASGNQPKTDGSNGKSDPVKEPETKKPKSHRVKLHVKTIKPHLLDDTQLNELVEVELQFKLQDQREQEKNDARNALEEYIYDMRDKLTSIYEDFIKPADNDSFRGTLTSMEDWLYEDGEDQPKKVYVEKLENLKQTGNAVQSRAREFETRPLAVDAFQKLIVQVQKFLTEHGSGAEKYSHLAEEDITKVRTALDEKTSWLNEKLAAQSALSKADEPALTTQDVEAAHSHLDRISKPIINKPKPKVEPPPAEPSETSANSTPEGNTAEQEQAKSADASDEKPVDGASEGMDLD